MVFLRERINLKRKLAGSSKNKKIESQKKEEKIEREKNKTRLLKMKIL